MTNKLIILFILSTLLGPNLSAQKLPGTSDEVSSVLFKTPPSENNVYTWYHWMNKSITKDGISKDLTAMSKQGIKGFTVFNVNLPRGKDYGFANVKFASKEWFEMFRFVCEESERLGLTVGAHNCDGWAGSGGPWISVDKSMKQYVWSKHFVSGGNEINMLLKQPYANKGFYKDAAVVAYPSDEANSFVKANPSLFIGNKKLDGKLTDGNPASRERLTIGDTILFIFPCVFKTNALAVTLYKVFGWGGLKQAAYLDIFASDDGKEYRFVSSVVDTETNKGVVLNIPETSAKYYKVVLKDFQKPASWDPTEIAELSFISQGERPLFDTSIPAFLAKTCAVMANSSSEFSVRASENSNTTVIASRNSVIDLSSYVSENGTLKWNAPKGNWTIIRFGFTTTGQINDPATAEGEGLECDKMDTTALNLHFANFPQKLIDISGKYKGNVFKHLTVDSWESNFQNWTDNFESEFKKNIGYDIKLFIPVLCGEVIESQVVSEAFLHDFRRNIAQLIELNYYKHFADLCHRNNLEFHGEAMYGGLPEPPLDILKANSYIDVPMTEFWARIDTKDTAMVHNRNNNITPLPIHAAQMYDKQTVGSEAYTSSAGFSDSPWNLKLWGDKAYTEGVSRMVLHSYVHQPTDAYPGMTLNDFGLTFNRHNPWFNYASSWFEFQSRVQYMLQKGKKVSDILIYIGDEMPVKFSNSSEYRNIKHDVCNQDILLNRARVANNRLVLNNGLSYNMLVLKDTLLDFTTLKKVEELVKAGITVYGPRPIKPLRLFDVENNRNEFQEIAQKLWGNIDGKSVTENVYGSGKVVWGQSLKTLINKIITTPDLSLKGIAENDFFYIHKKDNNTDIYYIVNTQEYKSVNVEATFRVSGKTPEIWNPVTGETCSSTLYTQQENTTTIPLILQPKQSLFVVFSEKAISNNFVKLSNASQQVLFPSENSTISNVPFLFSTNNFNACNDTVGKCYATNKKGKTTTIAINKPEIMTLNPEKFTITLKELPQIAPFRFPNYQSLTSSDNPAIKYYSGVVEYKTDFEITTKNSKNKDILLKLGKFGSTCEIIINDTKVAIAWVPNSEIDITPYVKSGINQLIINTTNPWRNSLAGNLTGLDIQRRLWTSASLKSYKGEVIISAKSTLLDSGLSSGVSIIITNK